MTTRSSRACIRHQHSPQAAWSHHPFASARTRARAAGHHAHPRAHRHTLDASLRSFVTSPQLNGACASCISSHWNAIDVLKTCLNWNVWRRRIVCCWEVSTISLSLSVRKPPRGHLDWINLRNVAFHSSIRVRVLHLERKYVRMERVCSKITFNSTCVSCAYIFAYSTPRTSFVNCWRARLC